MLIAICNDDKIENGDINYYPNTTPRTEETIAFYSCVSGYQLSGVGFRTCADVPNGMGGVWTGSMPNCIGMKTNKYLVCTYPFHIIVHFQCVAAICDNLTLANGVISYSPSTTPRLEGGVAIHSCDEGYGLSTSVTTRTCQPDRTWSGEDIICQRKHWVQYSAYISRV